MPPGSSKDLPKERPAPATRQHSERVVAGQYRLVESLAGTVWSAEDDAPNGSRVALKFLPKVPLDSPGILRSLRRETQALRSLEHRRLVRHRTFDLDGDRPFLAMDFIEGPSLAHLLAVRGRLTPAEVCQIGLQVCEGLGSAHGRGVIHAALKPSSLMLATQPRSIGSPLSEHAIDIRITGFGISCLRAEAVRRGEEIGDEDTLSHASPELIRGEVATERGDVYALGCVLYHLLSGRAPFEGKSRPRVYPLDGCPAELWTVIARCMAGDPAQRYVSVGEVRGALTRTLASRWNRSSVAVIGVLSAAAVLLAIFTPRQDSAPPPPAPQPPPTTVAAGSVPVSHQFPAPLGGRWKKSPLMTPKSLPPLLAVLPLPATGEAVASAASAEAAAWPPLVKQEEEAASNGELETRRRRDEDSGDEAEPPPVRVYHAPSESTRAESESRERAAAPPPPAEERSQARDAWNDLRHSVRGTFRRAHEAISGED